MRLVFVVVSCSNVERSFRVASMACIRTVPKRPPPARLHSGRTSHVVGGGALRCRECPTNVAGMPTRAGRKGRSRPFRGRGTTAELKTNWAAKVRPSVRRRPEQRVIREPAVPSTWREIEYRSRNAYDARQSVDLHEVMRSLENPMRTTTLECALCTRSGARPALRTSRTDVLRLSDVQNVRLQIHGI